MGMNFSDHMTTGIFERSYQPHESRSHLHIHLDPRDFPRAPQTMPSATTSDDTARIYNILSRNISKLFSTVSTMSDSSSDCSGKPSDRKHFSIICYSSIACICLAANSRQPRLQTPAQKTLRKTRERQPLRREQRRPPSRVTLQSRWIILAHHRPPIAQRAL